MHYTLRNDITVGRWTIPKGFVSDRCTWAPDRWFGIDLSPACILHDFLRRYAIVSVREADRELHAQLLALGAPRWLARFYWFAVKVTRPWFRRTQTLPWAWRSYRFPKAITK